MAFLNLLRNLSDFLRKPISFLRHSFFGPAPIPPINVVIVHVTKITLDAKDTIDGVATNLPPEAFQAALAAAAARESAVMKHNMASDAMLRNPNAGFEEEGLSYATTLAAGSTLLALTAALYFLTPALVSMNLLSSAVSLGVGLAAKGWGLDPHLAGLLSFTARLLLRAGFSHYGSTARRPAAAIK
jgi:hypothetical protein